MSDNHEVRLDIKRALYMLLFGESAPEARQGAGRARIVPLSHAETAAAVKVKYADWSKDPRIQGFGIGYKRSGGEITDELCLKVYVSKKLSKRRLGTRLVDELLEITGLEKIWTDVDEIGELEPEAPGPPGINSGAQNPIRPGASIFHTSQRSAGTLGCLVRPASRATPLFILSNSHVLALSGSGQPRDAIVHPGRLDAGSGGAPIRIAELTAWVSFNSGADQMNFVDAAIARVTSPRVTSGFADLGGQPPAGSSSAYRIRMRVKKVGRSTGMSVGEIRDFDFITKPIRYELPNGRVVRARFVDQVLCSQFTSAGDSAAAGWRRLAYR